MNTEKLELIRNLVDEMLEGEAEPVEVQEYTDEEISMSLTGTPDLHERNPNLFRKMSKFFDPDRVPFDDASWWRTAYQHKDSRPFKPVVIDGEEYRRTTPQGLGADYYWIGKGAQDLTADMWLFEPGHLDPSVEVQLDRIRRYEGGLRSDPSRWPEPYRSAYAETH